VVVDGDPWFVLADLCRALGIANAANVAARLSGEDRGVHRADTPGGLQNLTVVSESGMYEVVIRSDKPEAVRFRRWITGEVLPAIRRTGRYGCVPTGLDAEQMPGRQGRDDQPFRLTPGDHDPVSGVRRTLGSPPTPGPAVDRDRQPDLVEPLTVGN